MAKKRVDRPVRHVEVIVGFWVDGDVAVSTLSDRVRAALAAYVRDPKIHFGSVTVRLRTMVEAKRKWVGEA